MRYIQWGLEAAIPLLGFFAWDWNLYFILLFYFLDLLSAEMVVHLKARQIVRYRGEAKLKSEWLKYGVISALALFALIAIVHLAMYLLHPEIQFLREIQEFWTYEEMGVQQGYLFVPLVFFLGYQQFRVEFMMPARYRMIPLNEIWKTHLRTWVVLLLAGVLVGVVNSVVQLPELIYVLGIVVSTVAYKWWMEERP